MRIFAHGGIASTLDAPFPLTPALPMNRPSFGVPALAYCLCPIVAKAPAAAFGKGE